MIQTNILILTNCQDATATHLVARAHERNIAVLRLDTADFPGSLQLSSHFDGSHWQGSITTRDATYFLQDFKSIWNRRPGHYQVNGEFPDSVRASAINEASKGFGGILRSLPCLWINDLEANRAASFKPRQLQVAAHVGLKTPQTLITNEPSAVQRFYEEHHHAIVMKTLHAGFIPAGGDTYDYIYTTPVTPEILNQIERVRITAHCFQKRIEKAFDLRVTVIGEHVFPVAIESQHASGSRIDFRASYEHLRYHKHTLQRHQEQQCRDLVKRLGLIYGAIDMAVTPEGEYVFFECNPNGQYQWLEQEVPEFPFTDTLLDLLQKGAV